MNNICQCHNNIVQIHYKEIPMNILLLSCPTSFVQSYHKIIAKITKIIMTTAKRTASIPTTADSTGTDTISGIYVFSSLVAPVGMDEGLLHV